MAVFEYYQNMHDMRLKPRLLRSLTKEHLPDENHPFPGHSELSSVVSAIKTHGLLSESVGDSVDHKLLDKWKSAVDAWVERLMLLISGKMVDKRWAGICLLGLTCQECSAARFLASYSAWFHKLLLQIQQSSESQLVKVASCVSLSDMFTRLSVLLSVKKDVTSLAGKLVPPALKLLTEDPSESVWEGAIDLLCTLTEFFPSSVHRHYDCVEAAFVSKILSGKCNDNLSKKFANCLALLPKSRGDEDSWYMMMQKILILINIQLNNAFQGLEEETKGIEAMRLLVQPGKEPPPPLGGQLSAEASDHAAQTSEHVLFYRVSKLMQCCSVMLTSSYPVQVTVPVRPLLALVKRVLLVDGSSSQPLLSFMTVTQQEIICSELPSLHSSTLELLAAIIKGTRSQLLPNAAEVIRLVTEYSRRCKFSALRIKVYSIMKILLTSMGVGMALYLAQELINSAFVDLDSFLHGSPNAASNPQPKHAAHVLQQPTNKKRKHLTLTGCTIDQNAVTLELEQSKSKLRTPISVQIASLQALEALLTVGGALQSENWRSDVDFLLITVASETCERGWGNEERSATISAELNSTWADLQHAALRALLASFLSPSRCRPKYLARGLELFRRGKQETGTKLADFCAHALLALEALIHPRALPLADFSLGNLNTFDEGENPKLPENPFSGSLKHNNPFSSGIMGIDEPDPDDDLYKSWLGNGENVESPLRNSDKNMEDSGEPSQKHGFNTNSNLLTEKLPVDDAVGTMDVDEGRSKETTENVPEETGRSADELMVSAERSEVAIAFDGIGSSGKGVMIPAAHSNSSAPNNVSATDGITSVFGKEKQFVHGGDDSDNDSIPDIVDADPDSDD